MTREFASAGAGTIDMALDVCEFDETKARNLLKALADNKAKSPTR